jgi:thiol:disulfide interchange protein DsbD
MLGFGDLSALQNIGSRIGSGQPSAKNTLLMGAGAGLVAAPCTGPVLGALLTYSAGRAAPLEGIALMTMYSFGFALPYVFLGRAANSVTRIKVSPIVQITTKLFFAAIMFALCFYYFRIPFYEVVKAAKAHWTILAWIFGITGLSGIVTCVLVPRLQNAKMVMVLPCILFGFAIFSSWQALTTVVESKETKLAWHQDIEGAVVAAKLSGKNILIDNWAEWCEACKKMDVTTFMDADVRATLGKDWEIVKLDLTEGTEADDQHLAAYEITGLPTLVLLPPTGDIHQRENIVGYVTGSELLQRLKAFKDR